MARWLWCTTLQDKHIYINFDNAISIENDAKGQARIAFMGADKVTVHVKQSADELFDRLADHPG